MEPYYLQSRKRKMEEPDDLISEIATKLQQAGVPSTCFTDENRLVVGGFLIKSRFVSHLRPFQPLIGSATQIERLLQIGIDHKFFDSILEMQPKQFYDFLKFLKMEEGQEAQWKLAQLNRLIKKGGSVFTPAQVGWLKMFEAQRYDMFNKIREIRRKFNSERQSDEKRILMEQHIEKIKASFSPAGNYPGLLEPDQLNLRSWDEYIRHCNGAGANPAALSSQAMTDAALKFGGVAKEKHALEYLAVGDRQKQLSDYCLGKIGEFQKSWNTRAEKKLRGLLDVVGVAPDPAAETAPGTS